jgi:hypothetical protein
VFQLTGAAAFVGYALALWQMTIWYSRSLRSAVLATVDGVIYALLTASPHDAPPHSAVPGH